MWIILVDKYFYNSCILCIGVYHTKLLIMNTKFLKFWVNGSTQKSLK
jgi:hypothetical protein